MGIISPQITTNLTGLFNMRIIKGPIARKYSFMWWHHHSCESRLKYPVCINVPNAITPTMWLHGVNMLTFNTLGWEAAANKGRNELVYEYVGTEGVCARDINTAG